MLDLSQRTKQGRKIMAEVKKMQMSRLEHLYSHKNMASIKEKPEGAAGSNQAPTLPRTILTEK